MLKIINNMYLLYPPFRWQIQRLIEEWEKDMGYGLVPLETYRTPERQAALHDRPDTRANPPMRSMHQYGLAVDLVFDMEPQKPGRQDPYAGDWDELGKSVEAMGLQWGGRYGDATHVQWPIPFSYDHLMNWHQEGGQLLVWHHLSK